MADNGTPQILLIENGQRHGNVVRDKLAAHYGPEALRLCDGIHDVAQVDPEQITLALTDVCLPDGTGLGVLDMLLRRRPDLPVLLMTDGAGLAQAVEGVRRGAYDFVVKSGAYLDTVPLLVDKNLAVWRVRDEARRLRAELERALAQAKQDNRELRDKMGQLQTAAATDPLTGLLNRRGFSDAMDRAFADATRHDRELSCVMIDLDHFKQVNDTLGHPDGDAVLRCVARVFEAACRRSDLAGRFGGDEFVLLMPQTDEATACGVAERVREQFQLASGALFPGNAVAAELNMSMGLASLKRTGSVSAEQLLSQADAALYAAKRAGRARMMIYRPKADPAHQATA